MNSESRKTSYRCEYYIQLVLHLLPDEKVHRTLYTTTTRAAELGEVNRDGGGIKKDC